MNECISMHVSAHMYLYLCINTCLSVSVHVPECCLYQDSQASSHVCRCSWRDDMHTLCVL